MWWYQMKTIPLTQGMVAVVDDEDYAALTRHNWCVSKECRTYYAVRGPKPTEGEHGANIRMHRAILGVARGVYVDHRDGDGLNNQRHNLRVATDSQNQRNRKRRRPGTTSRHKGVSWDADRCRWQVFIRDGVRQPDGKHKTRFLGRFDDEDAAGRAYDAAALAAFGEFAALNFPSGT
jgi:hypothetical protein